MGEISDGQVGMLAGGGQRSPIHQVIPEQAHTRTLVSPQAEKDFVCSGGHIIIFRMDDSERIDISLSVIGDGLTALPKKSYNCPLSMTDEGADDRLIQLEVEMREHINQLLLSWLTNQGWPQLNRKEAFLIYQRLDWAAHVIKTLGIAPIILNEGEGNLTEWGVFQSWENYGASEWKIKIKVMCSCYHDGFQAGAQDSFAA
jgi:hypothetical protein